ncbi:hypothetical protein CPHO_00355 [Corynebacterium phocae]|uniref:Uncharacterized protein n=1 Tax=Corynebacterium phocae TaxID=161895 RepID=A0A1L7D0G0_9CORY|nr:hypothetical protein CPHO_00355 [Corynebacterium phocae]
MSTFGVLAGAAILYFCYGMPTAACLLLFVGIVLDYFISRKLELFPFYSDKDLKRLEKTKDQPIPEAEELRAYRKAHPEKNLAQAIADLRERG